MVTENGRPLDCAYGMLVKQTELAGALEKVFSSCSFCMDEFEARVLLLKDREIP